MTCPRCFAKLDDARGICPDCGVNLYRNVSGIVKTSVVMISAGDDCGFYDSVQEVPEGLRKQLIESTASHNSGTIVIADRAGKEQLTQVLARRDSMRERAKAKADHADVPASTLPDSARLDSESDAPAARHLAWIAWAAFILILALAAIVSAFFGLRW
jgi:hypothetical protein